MVNCIAYGGNYPHLILVHVRIDVMFLYNSGRTKREIQQQNAERYPSVSDTEP